MSDTTEMRDGHPVTCPAVVWIDGACTCEVPEADDYDMLADWMAVTRCPVCADPIDYCQGHGVIGDLAGYLALRSHNRGIHVGCHPMGCEEVTLGN